MPKKTDLKMPRPEITRNISRGVSRLFYLHDCACLSEFTLKNRRRIDVMCLDKKGKFTAIEVKSSLEDFTTDVKWQDYLPYCDQFYFAVSEEFPIDKLPTDTGLIIADRYDAEIIRHANIDDLNPSRRKALTLQFARQAAFKLTKSDNEL